MFRFPQKPTRRLALLSLFPALLVLSYFSLAHFTEGPARLAAPNPEAAAKRSKPGLIDLDHDGFPDVAELNTFNDRENFRRWFTWVAEMQFYKLNDQWIADQRDCAGLVRFAWREALRTHDRPWFHRMGENYDPVAPDLSSNIATPLNGKLFRTAPGTFSPTDLSEGKFSDFADAQTLKMFNSEFVGRDRGQAKPGDLLFFHQPWVQKFSFHVMIFIGEPRVASEGAHDWVVYHTGASPTDEGAVKKVRLAVLDRHPDKRWRPVSTNPNFLGFYRLKILTEPSAVAPGQSGEK
jgi:uncharacterized protein YfaT (DUF1175 family)